MTGERLIEQIVSGLKQDADEPEIIDKEFVRAAVLVPLFMDQGIWKILYIRRSNVGELHKGEVAFPGGGVEPGDADIFQTALRETHEELGVEPTQIQILGKFHRVPTVTKYAVTPVVGLLKWPVTITQNYIEVARVFSIPLSWLADKNNWRISSFEIPNRGKVSTLVYKTYDNENLWGFSAKVTQMLIELIKKEER